MRESTKIKIPESAITAHIRSYLRMKGIFHFKHWSGPMSEKGVPDILGVLPGGQALMIEVKTNTGKLSEYQQAFLENAKKNGAKVLVARCVEDVMEEGI